MLLGLPCNMLIYKGNVRYERLRMKPPHPAAATLARGRNGHGGSC